jgi:hypothetical protein
MTGHNATPRDEAHDKSSDIAKGVSEVLIRLVVDGRRWDFVFEGPHAVELLKVDEYIAACVEHVRLIQKPLPRVVGWYATPEPELETKVLLQAEPTKP